MSSLIFFYLFILLIYGSLAYLVMRYFNRWTLKSQYKTLWNTLIFIGSLALLLVISFIIFINTVSFER
ncbi:hypothetical protein SAMN05421639_101422 [Chryseobacterium shigense]|uniref:Uncharacterized protein n=1 Tax=Chryseobacterium shigense TaxID=297244 RepID=A0A1N7HX56_9FLAO|nr:hypothetical protein SAMN05421639_101422 [Chryseobacterium shigense]